MQSRQAYMQPAQLEWQREAGGSKGCRLRVAFDQRGQLGPLVLLQVPSSKCSRFAPGHSTVALLSKHLRKTMDEDRVMRTMCRASCDMRHASYTRRKATCSKQQVASLFMHLDFECLKHWRVGRRQAGWFRQRTLTNFEVHLALGNHQHRHRKTPFLRWKKCQDEEDSHRLNRTGGYSNDTTYPKNLQKNNSSISDNDFLNICARSGHGFFRVFFHCTIRAVLL